MSSAELELTDKQARWLAELAGPVRRTRSEPSQPSAGWRELEGLGLVERSSSGPRFMVRANAAGVELARALGLTSRSSPPPWPVGLAGAIRRAAADNPGAHPIAIRALAMQATGRDISRQLVAATLRRSPTRGRPRAAVCPHCGCGCKAASSSSAPELLAPAEAARVAGVTVRTLRRWVARGLLEAASAAGELPKYTPADVELARIRGSARGARAGARG